MSLASHGQICLLLKKTDTQIEEHIKKDKLPRKRGKKYDLVRVIHWQLEYDKKQIEAAQQKRFDWSVVEVADLFSQEVRTVDKNVKENGLPRKARGIFDIRDVIKWKIKQLEKRIADIKTGDGTYADAEKRDMLATAELREIKLAEARKETIAKTDMLGILKDGIINTTHQLASWPRKFAPRLVMKETPNEIELIIQKEIDALCTDLARIPDTLYSYGGTPSRDEGSLETIHPAEAAHVKPVVRRKPDTKQRDKQQRKRKMAK